MRIIRLATLAGALCVFACATLPEYTPVPQATLPDQGWTQAERDQFAHLSQGTKLLPRSWFLALEQPGLSLQGTSRFADPAYLARFGFIPDAVSAANPDGLPVGFAVDRFLPEDNAPRTETVVGLSCAACHTGQIEYRGRGVRIEGGPAMTDLSTFQAQMGLALYEALHSDIRFARFAGRVLELDGIPDTILNRETLREQLRAGVARGQDEAAEARRLGLYPLAEGYGRLDALGRGGNFLFGLGYKDSRNLAVADGPVSYPALWDAPWFDWVQYNGAIRQPLSRNVAEALGVRSLATLTGAESGRYVSSVRVDKIAQMERLLSGPQPGAGLRAPRWPEDLLGPVDRAAAGRGGQLYAQFCAACHAGRMVAAPPGTGQKPEIAVTMIKLEQIGTDPKAATNFAARRAFIAPESSQTITAAEGLQDVTERIIERWFVRNGTPAEVQQAMTGYRRNEWRSPLAYRARPLQGIWATAPYLHNGSVPNLYQLLLPAAQRDQAFTVGSRQFDPKRVGFETTPFRGGFRFDATLPGNLNGGHSFGGAPGTPGVLGPELTDPQRWDLIEFMKTL